MFIGHQAVAFAAKRAAPEVSLGTLLLAAQWLDLLWPILLLVGLEHARIDPGNTAFTPFDFYDYPISHSLVAVVGWSVAVGGVHYWRRRNVRAAGVLGAAVVSHWVLDAVTHRPDMPIWPGGPLVGLGLWNSIAGTVLVEGLLFAGSLWIYLRASVPRDRTGRWALAGLVALLVFAYLANLAGPPPPSVEAVGVVGLTAWLLVVWGSWIDRHRSTR